MADYWDNVIKKLSEFRLDTIITEDIPHTRIRITLLNTKDTGVSTYLVAASPISAKEKVSHQGLVVSTWPEVVIGILSETEDDGNQGSGKSWAVRPTRKDGKGWRKNSIMRVRGREYAARLLLHWWAEQNESDLERNR